MNNLVPVSKPYFPPIQKYTALLEGIWERRWLTNNGPLLQQLEKRLEDYFDAHVVVVTSGTVALEILVQSALPVGSGKIITTPFSFVGTTTALMRMGFEPHFVDIHPEHLLCDERSMPADPISENVVGMMITQVYGAAGPWERYEAYSAKFDIPLLYDAAHSFGNQIGGRQIATLGRGAALSFHATKVFGICEGGAIVTRNKELAANCRAIRSFGFQNDQFVDVGTNAKVSELHAAFGLCGLDDLKETISMRQRAFSLYRLHLPNSITLIDPSLHLESANFSYCPILLPTEEKLETTARALDEAGFASRRYFYPTIDVWCQPESSPQLPVSTQIAKRVLCLPLFHDLTADQILRICSIVKKVV